MTKVKFIGGRILEGFDKVYGGTPMTIAMFRKAFKDDPEFKIDFAERRHMTDLNRIKSFIKGADIVHVDDYKIYKAMVDNDIVPDVVGVTVRTPAKHYGDWNAEVPVDTFYKSKIIRLNNGEEKNTQYENQISYITHAVDLDYLKPDYERPRKYVLWAGDIKRPAKNFKMFEEISKMILPEGFEFKVLYLYKVQDYWDILEETAILVNTSKSETFCCAMFEAKAKGVATIYRQGLHGNMWKDSETQVGYGVSDYQFAIRKMLGSDFIEAGRRNRAYVEKNNTFKQMRDSYAKVYHEIICK